MSLAAGPRDVSTAVPQHDTTPASWGADLNRTRVSVRIGARAAHEARTFMRRNPECRPDAQLHLENADLRHLSYEIEACRLRVEKGERLVVIQGPDKLDFAERRAFAWLVANLLGEPLVQTDTGARVVGVWARPGVKRIVDGARYHHTREGGGPHTDNVSTATPWEYLVFSCIRPAFIGGESIMLSAAAVHQELLAVPEALAILRQPFLWEYRGISAQLYEAPIVDYDEDGAPRFRYLRRYLESAHQRAGRPLTPEQSWALDCLDAILELSRLQFRTRLSEGETLVTYDSQVLHARTSFCEASPQEAADERSAAAGNFRFFDRVWAKKRTH